MTQTVEQLGAACSAAITADPGPGGRQQVCALIRAALQDAAFVKKYVDPHGPERQVIYEDPTHKFAILAHSYKGAKDSAPHDHGPTWAIYGQATGTTVMTDWELVEPATPEKPGKVRKLRDYPLTPGMAYVYEPGVLHSPRRDDSTTLIRVEGFDLSNYKRLRYEPVEAATA